MCVTNRFSFPLPSLPFPDFFYCSFLFPFVSLLFFFFSFPFSFLFSSPHFPFPPFPSPLSFTIPPPPFLFPFLFHQALPDPVLISPHSSGSLGLAFGTQNLCAQACAWAQSRSPDPRWRRAGVGAPHGCAQRTRALGGGAGCSPDSTCVPLRRPYCGALGPSSLLVCAVLERQETFVLST